MVIREFVRNHLSQMKITGKLSNQIVLAVDEACANCIIHHHKCDGKQDLHISLYKKGKALHIDIKDTGKAFPLQNFRARTLNEMVSMRAKGGLGIMLIHRIMDEIQVEQRKGYYLYKFAKQLPR